MKAGPAAMALFALASTLAPLAAGDALASGARAGTVILLRQSNPDEVTAEAAARVDGELAAAGFEVVVMPLGGDDPLGDLESAGRERKAVAAFAIFVHPFEGGTSVAEIWVSDRIRQKVVIQNAVLHETDRGRGSEILAVRAVEILRANLADLWEPPSSPVPAPPEPPPAAPLAIGETPPPRPAFASGLGGGVGVGAIESFRSAGSSWSPEVMASYGWPHGPSLRLTLAGLGPDMTFAAASGSATAQRQLAWLEVVETWWPRLAVVPFVAAGAGAQHARVVGAGAAPYEGHTSSAWSAVTTVGAGAAIPLVATLSFVVEGRALATWPPTVVQIAGADAGHLGTPSLLADGSLFGTLP
jgi:hypothetical protein